MEPNLPGPSTIHVIKKKKKQDNLLSRPLDSQERNAPRKRKRIGVEDSPSFNVPRLQIASKGKELDKPFTELQKRRKKRKHAKGKTSGDRAGTETGPSSVTLASSDSPVLSSKEVDRAAEVAEKDVEIQQLQKELTTKNELLHKHESALLALQNVLQCQICLEMLWKPYLVSPCGHVLCEGCLKSWFSAGRDGPEDLIVPYMRKKTCPYCRTEVKLRPVSVYLIKSAVTTLIPSLDPSSYTLPEEDVPQGDQQNPSEPKDIWEGIFPPLAPLQGSEPAEHPEVMWDPEDGGIYRCRDCLHEVFDGLCTGCGRLYPGVDEGPSEGEYEAYFNPLFDGIGPVPIEVVSDSDGYEPSFIDDGEDGGPAIPSSTEGSGVGEVFHDAPGLDPEAGDEGPSNSRSSVRQMRDEQHFNHADATSDEDAEEHDSPYLPNRRRRHARHVVSGSDESERAVSGSLRSRHQTHAAIVIVSDDDDESQLDPDSSEDEVSRRPRDVPAERVSSSFWQAGRRYSQRLQETHHARDQDIETYGEDDFLPGPSRARRSRRPYTMGHDEATPPNDNERIRYLDSDHEDEEDVGSATSMSGSEDGDELYPDGDHYYDAHEGGEPADYSNDENSDDSEFDDEFMPTAM